MTKNAIFVKRGTLITKKCKSIISTGLHILYTCLRIAADSDHTTLGSSSVVNPDPTGSGTFSWIRIRQK